MQRSRISTPFLAEKPLPNHKNNKDIIALLGDSWIFNESMDHALKKELKEKNMDFAIISHGEPGAFSKKIYENLNTEEGEFAAQSILDSLPKYCIVIAGVNDAASQMGSNFYAEHMELIIRKLLEYNIKPIVVELPEFGIKETMKNAHWLAGTKNKIMSWINNGGETDNILGYREALITKLKNKNLWTEVAYVPYNSICEDYSDCLPIYKDPAHLNDKGKTLLSREIIHYLKQ